MRKKILVVDDTRILTEGVAEVLMMEDFTVSLAYNGREALEKFLRESPDLVVSDLVMPEFDGLELTRAIRSGAVKNTVPIIILTADISRESQQACKEAGADLVIQKPFDTNFLVSVINNLL